MTISFLQWISTDGKLLLCARIARTFAYGFLSVILAIYLKLIGFNDILIGIILSATLINSIIFTLFASFYADRIGRRNTLLLYTVMMSISGLIFFVTENPLALIIAALLGTLNITGSETSAFLSIEQSILPQTIKDNRRRNTLFGFYNMAGTFAMGAGILIANLPIIIQNELEVDQIYAIKLLFLFYSLLSVLVMGIYLKLSSNIEIKKQKTLKPISKILNPKSKKIVTKLSGLFAIDSFAGGFAIQSIVSFWFFTKFDIDLSIISYIFSIGSVLTAFSYLIAAKIADKIGLINTMVFTHIPSNILLVLLAFAPTLEIAIVFYMIRMALSQMDVPTRQSYIVAVVEEDERTAAAGITNLSRNTAQAISPSITGYIIGVLSLSAPFIIGGLLKIIYDITLYINFRKIKPSEEEEEEEEE
ncbi:MAG TPA: MFS transporter [Nitrososphaeraceae archaeon]|nr:MFS transporter [Nitrososphaeraceae archaeon]